MVKWLAQYSFRERAIVLVALLVLGGLMLHAMVIEPYQTRVAELDSQLRQQASDLAWMKSVISRLPTGGVPEATDQISGSLANFVDQAVRSRGLSGQLSQMTPIGSDEIRMRYSAVDFNRLVNFIAHINSSGLQVMDIRITSGDEPGIVDSSIVISRS